MAALVHEESHPAGSAILREGDFGECMYLILSGDVSISRADQYTLSAGPGELFGEMSLFDGETRFATVTAARRVRLLRLERRDLFELMDEQPGIAIGICQTLARHARDSIRRLEDKLAGNESSLTDKDQREDAKTRS
jgi:CRP-like cAMP-binding protein